MKITLIVTDKEGNKCEREWTPKNKRDIERRKEFIGRMLNEIEQEIGIVEVEK